MKAAKRAESRMRMDMPAMNQLTDDKKESIRQLALAAGASRAAWVEPADIPILPELQDYCRQNSCGHYATSWAGPPAIGEVAELSAMVHSCVAGLVVQTIGQLEDAYDYPGMLAARTRHAEIFPSVLATVRRAAPDWPILGLSAGCCHICGKCTYPDQPCLHPDEAIAPVEGYGIYVNAMLTLAGLHYNNGPDTVSYVGLILFKPKM
jgi:predicted metal-binding protein